MCITNSQVRSGFLYLTFFNVYSTSYSLFFGCGSSSVVSAGMLRIFGSDVAELPLVATSNGNHGKVIGCSVLLVVFLACNLFFSLFQIFCTLEFPLIDVYYDHLQLFFKCINYKL